MIHVRILNSNLTRFRSPGRGVDVECESFPCGARCGSAARPRRGSQIQVERRERPGRVTG